MRLPLLLLLTLTLSCATLPSRVATLDAIQMVVNATSVCTAWAAGPSQWISTRHCVDFAGDEGWSIAQQPVQVLARDLRHDLVLFDGPSSQVLVLAEAPPPVGAPLVMSGYGMNGHWLQFDMRLIALESQFFGADTPAEMLWSGANGLPGLSGAPVLWRGRVVSQVTGGGQPTGHAHLLGSGVPYAALRAFVRQHVRKVPYQVWGQ